jgi:protein involved in polysaccharide export with SLBB domain
MAVPTTAARYAAVTLAALSFAASPLSAQTVATSVTRGAAAVAQPGDQVRVVVWPQSAFGPPFTGVVDAFGNIVMPPIGVVEVGRIPIAQLRDTLITRVSKYIREPEVDVQVLRRVTINGAVMRPDIYFMDVSATLRDVIAKAGGINEEVGNKKKVSIIRNGMRINVPGWESDTSSTSVLRSGDQVLVGRRSWLEINIIPVASLSLATASFLLSLRHR